jgi:ubiquinone/menaquinone biosynthesis C-methylase UbiE
MALIRSPYQGVWNIIRFNWHYFVLTSAGLCLICLGALFFAPPWPILILVASFGVFLSMLLSLIISHFIYDRSSLYELQWFSQVVVRTSPQILNLHAGFDEITDKIIDRCPDAGVTIADFYNSEAHPEVSIKRARRAYPPHPSTIQVQTHQLPFYDKQFDYCCIFLAAHEIRNDLERTQFFREINRVTQNNGSIMVTEHLRDWPNFFAYTVGYLHFHSHSTWLDAFIQADLFLEQEIKITPFISTFILKKNGTSS